MANTSIRGTSSDGIHVNVGSNAYIIKAKIPLRDGFYVVLGKASFSMVSVFSFDGDIGDMNGMYTLVEGATAREVLEQYEKYYKQPEPEPVKKTPEPIKKTPEPKPIKKTPEPKPIKKRPEPEPEPEEEEEPYQDTSFLKENDYRLNQGGGFLYFMCIFNYVLGILFGLAVGVGVTAFFGYFIGGWMGQNFKELHDIYAQSQALDATLLEQITPTLIGMIPAIPLSIFFFMSMINCIVCMVKIKRTLSPYHKAVMVVGLVNANIFAILGGWFHYHYWIHRFKLKPRKG